jgi:type VI secretion system protein ImpK
VDEVFASMQRLSPQAQPVAAAASDVAAPVADGPARLRAAMAGELRPDSRIVVRDEAHRSTVSIPADLLFDGGGTRLLSSAAPLLARIGTTLSVHPGKVVVIGHTDGTDRRSARLPSAWHQSYEWARETAGGLEQTLPAHRLAVEGAADQDAGSASALPRRRIDIVLYP